jgi:hypothetical protein
VTVKQRIWLEDRDTAVSTLVSSPGLRRRKPRSLFAGAKPEEQEPIRKICWITDKKGKGTKKEKVEKTSAS